MVTSLADTPESESPRVARSPVDMDPLFAELAALRERLGPSSATRQVTSEGRAAFLRRTGFRARGGTPDIVVGAEVALELGHPDTESITTLVWTRRPGRLQPGRVSLVGPDLGELPRRGRVPFGLVVLLELGADASPDPFSLDQLLRLTNRLPGYMVRALPGRLWARVGARALSGGLSLLDVGEGLTVAYAEAVDGLAGVEVLLVTASAEAVRLLVPLAAEARVFAGQHKKLTLAPDGSLECEELDCEDCDERVTCDSLRDVLARRRGGAEASASSGAGTERPYRFLGFQGESFGEQRLGDKPARGARGRGEARTALPSEGGREGPPLNSERRRP